MRSVIGRPADCILISGDIAYGGQDSEYEFAYHWLERDRFRLTHFRVILKRESPSKHLIRA
jgi:3',5'-cyclic AMP phosphodiesterase CpdA